MPELATKEGNAILTIKQLISLIESMSDSEFKKNVSGKKNKFSAWLGDICGHEKLANTVAGLKTKAAVLKALGEFRGKCSTMYESIIIGCGISGIAAAVYAARKRMRYLVISGDIGGQIAVSGDIFNYPGYAKTTFIEFQENMEKQLKLNEVNLNEGEYVKKIEKTPDGHFKVKTDKDSYETKSVLIASGARARELGVPGEKEYKGKGLTYCAICDGPLFKNKEVAVIGGGNSALEAAEFMLRIATKIHVISIGEVRGHEYLMEKVIGQSNVEIHTNTKTTKILGGKFVTGIEIEEKGKKKVIPVQGVIVEIGRIPNTEFAKGLVAIDDHGHVIVDKFCKTNVDGIYAAGDCTDIHEYQFCISGGMGCLALLQSARTLQKTE